ncbi:DUF6141 family protein [Halomicrococcus sp. SG-WS-1]|uniref:DUF6141 family protein n=1 Tax=Halomicrococcus sp. SG-WS-1 TaxID=3439057 RepID=UPI003F78BD2E
MASEVHYRETQRYRQPWLWALLVVRPVLALVGLARGTKSKRDVVRELAAFGGVALLLGTARLTTEVRDDALYLKFEPFHRSFRRIPFDEVTGFEATGYSPVRFGGWGVRWTPGTTAYTVSGRSGVEIDRTNDRSTYVGSKRPEELLAAVQEATERTL